MNAQDRPVSALPIVCSSAGIFLMVVGLLSLLPGRDTTRYLESGAPTTLNESLSRPVAARPRVLPSNQTFVVCKGRFYHWDPQCQLFHHVQERHNLTEVRMTRAEAEAAGYYACDFCDRP